MDIIVLHAPRSTGNAWINHLVALGLPLESKVESSGAACATIADCGIWIVGEPDGVGYRLAMVTSLVDAADAASLAGVVRILRQIEGTVISFAESDIDDKWWGVLLAQA